MVATHRTTMNGGAAPMTILDADVSLPAAATTA